MLQSITSDIETAFRALLPEDRFDAAGPSYLEEPRGRYAGQAGLLARPQSTAEVSRLVSKASQTRVPVIPYGGGTGLVGGQVAPDGPVPLILSLERMDTVRAVFVNENVMLAEAGAILADIQSAARDAGRLFPLSLASEGSARLGGLFATNAGGTGVLRYGNARDLCLGVEAVLPDGSVLNGLGRLRKDNAGYDLRHLLIGSEGTLGVITALSLRLFAQPKETAAALFQVPSPSAALSLLSLARDYAGDGVSAFEIMHRQGFDFLAETMPDVRIPWEQVPEWSVLVELGVSNGAQDLLEQIFEAALTDGFSEDGLIAQSARQRDMFWAVRESIPLANRKIGAVSSHDISVPLGAIAEFVAKAPDEIATLGPFRVNCFGHVGDGNLHFNVFPVQGRTRADHEHQRDAIKGVVHDLVHRLGGSVSAEHGVGRLKVTDLERYGDPGKLAAMRAIKQALDPDGIMNPGAVLRAAN